LTLIDSIKDIKDKLQVPFSMEIIILASWSIWIVRNNNVFNNQRPRFACWKAIYKEELRLLKHIIRNICAVGLSPTVLTLQKNMFSLTGKP
jgi:hypothetical protein